VRKADLSRLKAAPVFGPWQATVVDVHDGDTVRVLIDLGFSVRYAADVRLLGLNAIELGDPGGIEAKAHLQGLLTGPVTVSTVKPDKYGGRYDAVLTTADGANINNKMVADGYAAPWNGAGPKPVPPWPIPAKP
jgi:endonuclease YncB( thermonuclease family)